jgi:hypothetical protein
LKLRSTSGISILSMEGSRDREGVQSLLRGKGRRG